MIDKCSLENDSLIAGNFNCRNKRQHFLCRPISAANVERKPLKSDVDALAAETLHGR